MLQNMRISKKLWMGTGVVLFVIIALGLSTIYQKSYIQLTAQETERAHEKMLAMQQVRFHVLDMQSLTRGVLITNSDFLRDIYTGTVQGYETGITRLKTAMADDPDGLAMARELERVVRDLRLNVYEKQLSMAGNSATLEAALEMERSGQGWPFLEKVLNNTQALIDRQQAELAMSRAGLAEVFANVDLIIMLVLIIVLVVLLFFGMSFGRSISAPIVQISSAMHRLAQKDYSVEIPHSARRDEIGEMAEAVGVFKTAMQRTDKLTAERERAQQAVSERAEAMRSLTTDFDGTVSQMLNGVDERVKGMCGEIQEMQGIAHFNRSRSQLVRETAVEASSNMETVASATEEMRASIEEIAGQAARSSEISLTAQQKTHESHETVQQLAGAAEKIGEVVSLINEIAEQTNLLALNATIEAARAGDAGKGFAVVASEVKNLANQTARATSDIGDQITSIQDTTRLAVSAMDATTGVIEEITSVAGAIASAVEEQSAAMQEVSSRIAVVADGARQVRDTMDEVSDAAAQNEAKAGAVTESSKLMQDQAVTLLKNVKGFLDRVRTV